MEDQKQPSMNNNLPIVLEVRVVGFSLHQNKLQVLLQPALEEQAWSLPGQIVTGDLALETAAAICVEDLTGLKEIYLEQLYSYGDPTRQPGGRVISVVYFALLPAGGVVRVDETRAAWLPVDPIPLMVWDHSEILTYALRRLRYKLEYSAVGFELLPDAFTLSELQHTYELILGEQLDKRNFRRRILEAGIIEPTTERRSGEGRPAQLYRYQPDAVAEVKARRLFP